MNPLLPPPPYYAVLFSSQRTEKGQKAYEKMAEKMENLAKAQKGFIGIESVRDAEGFGITVSYWESQEDIISWKNNNDHLLAQELGRQQWYKWFVTRVCKVERQSGTEGI